MSRSYRKYPQLKCERSCKWGKRQANKKIRNLPITEDLPKGGGYKKYFEQWDICDYTCTMFKEWVIDKWHARQKDNQYNVKNFTHWANEKTLEEELALWKKDYLCK